MWGTSLLLGEAAGAVRPQHTLLEGKKVKGALVSSMQNEKFTAFRQLHCETDWLCLQVGVPPALPSLPASPKAKQPAPTLVRAESPEPAAELETPDVDPEPAPGRKVRASARAAWVAHMS